MHERNIILEDTEFARRRTLVPNLDEIHTLLSDRNEAVYPSVGVGKISRMCCNVYSFVVPLRGYLVFSISMMLWMLGESAAVFHLPNYAQQKGSSSPEAAILFTAMGVGSVFSRITTGMVASDPAIPYTVLHVGLAGLAGMVLLFFPLYSHCYSTQLVFGLLYGTYSQGLNALIGPAILDLVAKENMSVAYGFIYFFCGIGNIIGPHTASKC